MYFVGVVSSLNVADICVAEFLVSGLSKIICPCSSCYYDTELSTWNNSDCISPTVTRGFRPTASRVPLTLGLCSQSLESFLGRAL